MSHARLTTSDQRPRLAELWSAPAGQWPTLDALRGLAILLVVTGHGSAAYTRMLGGSNVFARLPFVRHGWIGVDLFFVLSGLLIGKQLWAELGETGSIRCRRFLLRRGLRIWPLYLAVFVYARFVHSGIPWRSIGGWSDLVFLTNYVNQGVVMGSWSLCTEEQFYLVAPLLLLLGVRLGWSHAGYRWVLVGLLALLPAVRTLTWYRLTGDLLAKDPHLAFLQLSTPFHTHADGLIVGLLLASIASDPPLALRVRRVHPLVWIPIALLLGLGLIGLQKTAFTFTALALIFGSWVWAGLTEPPRWLGLVRSPLVFALSRLSYGMYLNHEYMQEAAVRFTTQALPGVSRWPALGNGIAVVVLIALSAAVAVLTYLLIELPFLRLRARWLARSVVSGVGVRPSQPDPRGTEGSRDRGVPLEMLQAPSVPLGVASSAP